MNRALIHELATGRFIAQREDAVFLGPPGTGKSHLARSATCELGIGAGRSILTKAIGIGDMSGVAPRARSSELACGEAADRHLGLLAALTATVPDARVPARVTHGVGDLVAGIRCGCRVTFDNET